MMSFQASVSKGWLHEKSGFTFDSKYYMDPVYRQFQDKRLNDFVRKTFPDYPIYNMEANLMQADFVNDDQLLVGGIQPNLILAYILGAEFVYYPDKDMDVSGNPLQHITSAEYLPSTEQILAHPFIKNLDALIVHLQKTHPEAEVIPPFFWDNSGRATIHGIITTSFKLIGDNAMMMIIMDPALLHSVHQWITDAYTILINHYATLANMPITSVHVGECSGSLISNDQYIEFVNPYIDKLGKSFKKIRLHSCGFSDHIIEAISEIENLSALDTGSNTSVSKIRKVRGKGFMISIEPPVMLMLQESSQEDLMIWLGKTLEENAEGHMKFVLHLESGYSSDNCLMIYDELNRRMLIS